MLLLLVLKTTTGVSRITPPMSNAHHVPKISDILASLREILGYLFWIVLKR